MMEQRDDDDASDGVTTRPAGEVDSWAVIECVSNIARQAMYITPEMVWRVLGEMTRLHTLGPILDPTAYQSGMGNVVNLERVLGAFATFRDELEQVRGRGRQEGDARR